MCVLGDRLLTSKSYLNNIDYCTKSKFCEINNETQTCPLYGLYCNNETISANCDTFWLDNKIQVKKAFPGFPNEFFNNLKSGYLKTGESTPGEKGDFNKGQVIEQDTSTSFFILIGIFFPSVTGILAGIISFINHNES
jgi:hypothetical protein